MNKFKLGDIVTGTYDGRIELYVITSKENGLYKIQGITDNVDKSITFIHDEYLHDVVGNIFDKKEKKHGKRKAN